MKTLDEQLNECLPDWTKLIAALIPQIRDYYRATDDPDDNTPGMQLTIGFTQEREMPDAPYSWHYQTGDNSYSGGAYLHVKSTQWHQGKSNAVSSRCHCQSHRITPN